MQPMLIENNTFRQSHTIGAQQAKQLGQHIAALNAAQAALQMYFSAVADGLGLPEGTQLVRVDDTTMTVDVRP